MLIGAIWSEVPTGDAWGEAPIGAIWSEVPTDDIRGEVLIDAIWGGVLIGAVRVW